MPIDLSKFFSNIFQWIQSQQQILIKHSFSLLKKQYINIKIKKIPKYNTNFESIKPSLLLQQHKIQKTQKQHSTNITYVSINDFRPIIENYSSIKTMNSHDDSALSSENNYVSTRMMNIDGVNTNYQTVNLKKLNFKQKKKYNQEEDDKIDKDTFLENWMTRENMDFYMFQQFPKSNYCFKKIRSYHQQALDSIKKYSFQAYCSKNIKPSGILIFKNIKNLKHSSSVLSDSLIYLNQIQTQKSLQINQNLLKAGGQILSPIHYLYHIYRILQLLQSQSDDLIQQSYLQIIKQLQSKKVIYMEILCVFACCVKPSARLYLPVLNYLMEEEAMCTVRQGMGITEEQYNYCFFHLIKNFDQPRNSLPSFYQIRCFMSMKKVPITISFPKEKIFNIESYTKIQQLLQQIITFYDLDPIIQYLLLINGCFLQKGILLDKLNHYQSRNIHKKWKDYQKFKSFRCLIVLKNMNEYKKSKRCFNIMYNYYINQYLKGLFPLKQKDVIQIAGMIICSQVIDQEDYNFDFNKVLSARLRRKIQIGNPQEKNKYKNLVLQAYFKFNKSKLQARKRIVTILSESKGYMTHFFRCAVFFDQLQEEENWVGVKRNKFIFIDPENGRFIRQIYYTSIVEWGASKSQLCIKVDKIGIIHIDTLQAEVLTSIFQTYVNYLYMESQSHLPKKNDQLEK